MKKGILFFISGIAAFLSVFTFSFAQNSPQDFIATGTFHTSVSQGYYVPCQPNKAVYPNGVGDPCTNGGLYRPDFVNPNGTGRGLFPFSLGIGCNLSAAHDFKSFVTNFVLGCIINPLIPVIMGLALLVFLWGVFKFIRAEGDEKEQGRKFLIWGIVGLFVMVSIWGLVSILQYTFGLNTF